MSDISRGRKVLGYLTADSLRLTALIEVTLFLKSLISRVIILTILLLSTGIGIFTLFHIRREQVHLVASTRESAELLLTTVENSIFNSMRIGNSEDVQAILEMVGRSHRLTNVRIFSPDGTILKSAHPEEIGARVDTYDLALFVNGRTRGFPRSTAGKFWASSSPSSPKSNASCATVRGAR